MLDGQRLTDQSPLSRSVWARRPDDNDRSFGRTGRGGTVRMRGSGAEDGTRTRDPHLGNVMLYQLSHFRPMLDHSRRVVPRARIELATPRFSVACSTD